MNIILCVIIISIIIYIIYRFGILKKINNYFDVIETFVDTLTDSNFQNLTKVKSDIDGKYYFVQAEYADKKDAVELLSELNNLVDSFISNLKIKHSLDPRIERILNRFPNTENIIEGNPINDSNSTAYSVDKGKKLVVCLRSKRTKKLHDKNLLMFVVIHELAHIASSSFGHNNEFTENFKFLLSEAINEGLYKKVNFAVNPQEYCGLKIYTSPL
jgi:beta-galactosidase beta subunit